MFGADNCKYVQHTLIVHFVQHTTLPSLSSLPLSLSDYKFQRDDQIFFVFKNDMLLNAYKYPNPVYVLLILLLR